MKSRSVYAAVVCFTLAAIGHAAPADEWIAKARAFLGGENVLNAVSSVHFTGVIETVEKVPSAEDPNVLVDRPLNLPVEIVFQKNDRQLITVRAEKFIESTALDGYDAWQKRTDPENPSKWQLTLLDALQVKRLRANTWENLFFFKGIEKRGGRVEFQGDATLEGRACVKMAFVHADNIVFTRYFDKATGQLLLTITESGGEIREEGQTMVAGIRFPKKVINKNPGGQVTMITFDTVRINAPRPAADFAVPELTVN